MNDGPGVRLTLTAELLLRRIQEAEAPAEFKGIYLLSSLGGMTNCVFDTRGGFAEPIPANQLASALPELLQSGFLERLSGTEERYRLDSPHKRLAPSSLREDARFPEWSAKYAVTNRSLRASVSYSAAVHHTACLIQKTLPHGLVPPFTEQLFAEWAETNCAEPVFQVVRIFG